ncbi:oligosaccharide repeat unit polymerase [Alistipes timonensis]|jgi:hypothetical protein|uniref:oligosaccharide repeat unit polymerase n=1 Tax=Alistipes timonensis TaxID=1465754 RepID=UPI00189A36DC|nr:oligosaccharide repeat unit polymerase [Alistipes timonensis]
MYSCFKDVYYRHIKSVIIIYLLSVIVSYLYAVITDEYNGDFLRHDVTLSSFVLFLIFIFSAFPFFYLWKRYKYYKRHRNEGKIQVKVSYIEGVAIFLVSIRIFIFSIFQTDGPSGLGWIMTILETFNPFVFFCIYFIRSTSYNKFIIALLFLIESYVRHSLNGVYSCGVLFLFCYYSHIKQFIKKHIVFSGLLLILFPVIISNLYTLRASLRDTGLSYNEMTNSDIVAGVLAGRLSSYSNAAFLIEDFINTYIYSQDLPSLFFQSRIMDVYGVHIVPYSNLFPEKYLYVRSQNGSSESQENLTSYMVGTPGILILSFLKSPWVCLLNLLTLLLFIELSFYLLVPLNLPFVCELAVILLLYPLLSGVSVEFFYVITQLIMLRLFLWIGRLKCAVQ